MDKISIDVFDKKSNDAFKKISNDVLSIVFRKLEKKDLFVVVPFVCKRWRIVRKRIDVKWWIQRMCFGIEDWKSDYFKTWIDAQNWLWKSRNSLRKFMTDCGVYSRFNRNGKIYKGLKTFEDLFSAKEWIVGMNEWDQLYFILSKYETQRNTLKFYMYENEQIKKEKIRRNHQLIVSYLKSLFDIAHLKHKGNKTSELFRSIHGVYPKKIPSNAEKMYVTLGMIIDEMIDGESMPEEVEKNFYHLLSYRRSKVCEICEDVTDEARSHKPFLIVKKLEVLQFDDLFQDGNCLKQIPNDCKNLCYSCYNIKKDMYNEKKCDRCESEEEICHVFVMLNGNEKHWIKTCKCVNDMAYCVNCGIGPVLPFGCQCINPISCGRNMPRLETTIAVEMKTKLRKLYHPCDEGLLSVSLDAFQEEFGDEEDTRTLIQSYHEYLKNKNTLFK